MARTVGLLAPPVPTTPPASGIALENDGVPVTGAPFDTIDMIGGGVTNLGGGRAAYDPPGKLPDFPADSCVDIGSPATPWLKVDFPGEWVVGYSPTLRRHVAVGSGAALVDAKYSDDGGATWTDADSGLGLTYAWTACVWSEELGLYVALGTDGGTNARSMTSPDGITWTPQAPFVLSVLLRINCVAAGDASLPILVAVTARSASVGVCPALVSSDGITWTEQATVTPIAGFAGFELIQICYSPDFVRFLVVGQYLDLAPPAVDAGLIITTDDGSTWTKRTGPGGGYVAGVSRYWSACCYSPFVGNFVIGGVWPAGITPGTNPPLTAYSANGGVLWTGVATIDSIDSVTGLVWADDYKGGCYLQTLNNTYTLRSADGTAWTIDETGIAPAPGAAVGGPLVYAREFNGFTEGGTGHVSYKLGEAVPCDIWAKRLHASETIEADGDIDSGATITAAVEVVAPIATLAELVTVTPGAGAPAARVNGSVWSDNTAGLEGLYTRQAGVDSKLATVSASDALIKVASHDLTNAEILALATTGILLAAAAGANRMHVPLKWMILTLANSAAFTNINAAARMYISYDNAGGINPMYAIRNNIGPTQLATAMNNAGQAVLLDNSTPDGTNQDYRFAALANCVNAPLYVFLNNNGGGNLTGGNAANRIRVVVWYATIPTN